MSLSLLTIIMTGRVVVMMVVMVVMVVMVNFAGLGNNVSRNKSGTLIMILVFN